MFRNVFGGLIFVSIVFFTAIFGSILEVAPVLPLLLVKPNWFRWIVDKLLRTWLPLPAAILELFLGTKLYITTEDFPENLENDRALIIMNHRTRLDWLYFFNVMLRYGKLDKEKIILKNELKYIPGPGWVMQGCMYIFLKRKWEHDERYMHQILNYFTDINYPLQLLLFPEGTDYDPNTLARSKEYAMKNNLPLYNHVLHPRLRGFTYCVQQLKQRSGVDAIHDVTVGYRGCLCRSELDLLMGNFPQEVHFHIKRYPISQIPESEEDLEKWCTERWAEKEEMLERFYKNENFAGEEKRCITRERKARLELIFWLIYWAAFLCVVPVLLYYYIWLRWYTVFAGLVFFLLATCTGGLEHLQLWRHSLTKKHSDHQNNYASASYLDGNFRNGKPHVN